jgi:hypothetical protein
VEGYGTTRAGGGPPDIGGLGPSPAPGPGRPAVGGTGPLGGPPSRSVTGAGRALLGIGWICSRGRVLFSRLHNLITEYKDRLNNESLNLKKRVTCDAKLTQED